MAYRRQTTFQSECTGNHRWTCKFDANFDFEGCCTINPCASVDNGVFCARENPRAVLAFGGQYEALDYIRESLSTTVASTFTPGTFKPTSTRAYSSRPATKTKVTVTTTALIGPLKCIPPNKGYPTRSWHDCDYDGFSQPFGGCCSQDACDEKYEYFCKYEAATDLGTVSNQPVTATRGPFGTMVNGVVQKTTASTSTPTGSGDSDDFGGRTTSPEKDTTGTASPAAGAGSGGSSENHKTTIGIAAGVAGGVLLLAIVAGIAFFLLWKKRKAKRAAAVASMSNDDGSYPFGSQESKTDSGSRRASGWFSPGGKRHSKNPTSPTTTTTFTDSTTNQPAIVELDDTATSALSSSTNANSKLPRYSGVYNAGGAGVVHEMGDTSSSVMVHSPTTSYRSPLLGHGEHDVHGQRSPAFSDHDSQWGGSTRGVSEISEVDGRERFSRTGGRGSGLGVVEERGRGM